MTDEATKADDETDGSRSGREQLELAAVEPDGLARLMAGDTAAAAGGRGASRRLPVVRHELERLDAPRRSCATSSGPRRPADLRERTLAFVAANGVLARGRDAAAVVGRPVRGAVVDPRRSWPTSRPARRRRSRTRRRAGLRPTSRRRRTPCRSVARPRCR